MVRFLSENWGNILVIVLVAAAVVGAVVNIRRKKASGCTCGCGGCPSKGICHPKQ